MSALEHVRLALHSARAMTSMGAVNEDRRELIVEHLSAALRELAAPVDRCPAFRPGGRTGTLCATCGSPEVDHDPQACSGYRPGGGPNGRYCLGCGYPQAAHVPRSCPDGGRCHHECGQACWRVTGAGPLSGVYPGDRWPEDVRSAHIGPVLPDEVLPAEPDREGRAHAERPTRLVECPGYESDGQRARDHGCRHCGHVARKHENLHRLRACPGFAPGAGVLGICCLHCGYIPSLHPSAGEGW